MRRILTHCLAGLLITVAVVSGADNSIGTWKLNISKSQYEPAPMPVKSLTMVREAAPGGVTVKTTGERTDGSLINSSYTLKYDGPAARLSGSGAPYDTISAKQVDANTFTYEAKQSQGKYDASGRSAISSDGKTMTTTSKGTNGDGKPMSFSMVYDKQ